jgi:hypothetical protein
MNANARHLRYNSIHHRYNIFEYGGEIVRMRSTVVGHGRSCHVPSDGLAHFVIQPVRETVAKVNWFEYQLVGGRL